MGKTKYQKLLEEKLLLCQEDGEYHKCMMEYNLKVAKIIQGNLNKLISQKKELK